MGLKIEYRQPHQNDAYSRQDSENKECEYLVGQLFPNAISQNESFNYLDLAGKPSEVLVSFVVPDVEKIPYQFCSQSCFPIRYNKITSSSRFGLQSP